MSNIEQGIPDGEAKARRRKHIALGTLLTWLFLLASIATILACFVVPKFKKEWGDIGCHSRPPSTGWCVHRMRSRRRPACSFLSWGLLAGSITYRVLALRPPRPPRRGFDVVIQKTGDPAKR